MQFYAHTAGGKHSKAQTRTQKQRRSDLRGMRHLVRVKIPLVDHILTSGTLFLAPTGFGSRASCKQPQKPLKTQPILDDKLAWQISSPSQTKLSAYVVLVLQVHCLLAQSAPRAWF